jgi:hypothetical protein
MKFEDLLWFHIRARVLVIEPQPILIIGDNSNHLPNTLHGYDLQLSRTVQICFGLSLLTEPYPLLLSSVFTERNTQIKSLAAFSWVEENAIFEPRAELMGLTPFGKQPIVFLRDVDLDAPPQAYIPSPRGIADSLWMVGGVIIMGNFDHRVIVLKGDSAALTGIAIAHPAFAEELRMADLGADSLRSLLKTRRRATDPELTKFADGWLTLAKAVNCVGLRRESNEPETFQKAISLCYAQQ